MKVLIMKNFAFNKNMKITKYDDFFRKRKRKYFEQYDY